MFHRPLSSVALDMTPASQGILAGHPVFVQVDYETRLPSFDKTAAGGRIRRQLGDRVSVGGTYVQDELQAGSYELEALDVELRASENTRFTAEVARSSGSDARVFVSDDGGLTYSEIAPGGVQEGSAWKVAAELDIGEWFGQPGRHGVKLYAKELEPGFFSGGNAREQGTRKTGAIGRFEITRHDTIEVRQEREEQEAATPMEPGSATESTVSSILWRHVEKRSNLDVELFSSETLDDSGNVLRSSDLGAVRFSSKLGDRLTTSVEHQQTLSGQENDQSSAGLRYQVSPSLALDVKGTSGDRGSSAQVGAILDVGKGSVYVTERVNVDAAGRKEATIVGTRSPIGKGSEVYTEYQLERSEDRDRVISLLGIQRQWDPGPRFRFRISGETADVDSAGGGDRRSAFAISLSHQNPDGLTAQTRNEIRLDSGSRDRTQWTSFTKLDYKFDPSLTLLARHRYSKSEDRDDDRTEARLEERSFGLAYRPVTHDRFNMLAKYTRLLDRRPDSAVDARGLDRTMDVLAVETVYQIRPRVEWLAKFAGRSLEERFEDRPAIETRSMLLIQRFNVLLKKPFDLGMEYRVLTQREAEDRRQGWLGELTWRLHTHFRVGVGYNFTDFSDDEFSQNDASVHGWFLRVQGIY